MKHILMVALAALLGAAGIRAQSVCPPRTVCGPPQSRAEWVRDSTALDQYQAWLTRTTKMDTLPTVYAEWWNELRAQVTAICGCADEVLLQSVYFATMPGFDFVSHRSNRRAYANTAYSLSIVIASAHVLNKQIVQHEMLHVLIGGDGHPDIFRQLHLRAEDLVRPSLSQKGSQQ